MKRLSYIMQASLILMFSFITTSEGAIYTSIQLTENSYINHDPQISDNGHIVWSGDGIFLYDRSTISQLSNSISGGHSPYVNDNGFVVWVSYRDVYLYDGKTNTKLTKSNNNDISSPKINNKGHVVWQASDGSGSEIFLYDGSTTTPLTDNNFRDRYPQIDNNTNIVWSREESYNGPDTFYLFNGSNIVKIADNILHNSGFPFIQIANKNNVIWDESGDIFQFNGSSISQISIIDANNRQPNVSDNGYAVWWGTDQSDKNIYIYDGSNTSKVTTDLTYIHDPKINNRGHVVWSGSEGMYSDFEIYYFDGTKTTQITDNDIDDEKPQMNNSDHIVWQTSDGSSSSFDIFYAVPYASYDFDGDGYTEEEGDCNNNDNTIYPGATETCNDQIDQDCDGHDICLEDIDNDGDGYTENKGDCNDSDVTIYPGALEICGDGIDQDCDKLDKKCEGDIDYDSDGYTENQGDCNDFNPSISPDAQEICGDGIDQDCDGSDLECTVDPEDKDYDSDGYSVNQGDCDDSDATVYPGASEICGDGLDQDCNESDAVCQGSVDGGYKVTSELWTKAILQIPGSQVTLVWKMVGADTTPSGDQVISGYFYADPNDFAYGSEYNPEVFVKIYIDTSGWCNIAFNHVTVDDVTVYSAHKYVGVPSQSATATIVNRLVENQYNGVSIDNALNSSNDAVETGSYTGYTLCSSLWAKAVLQPPKGAIYLIWKEVGTDTTPSGDMVVSGYFYADPNVFDYGSIYNPEVFVKVYIASNGWTNIAFNHVTVDEVDLSSSLNNTGRADQTDTATLKDRLMEHQYDGVSLE